MGVQYLGVLTKAVGIDKLNAIVPLLYKCGVYALAPKVDATKMARNGRWIDERGHRRCNFETTYSHTLDCILNMNSEILLTCKAEGPSALESAKD